MPTKIFLKAEKTKKIGNKSWMILIVNNGSLTDQI